mgnify:CR=1 FL=1
MTQSCGLTPYLSRSAVVYQNAPKAKFSVQPDIRSYLTRDFAEIYPNQYKEVIRKLQDTCAAAAPNDAHLAIAEYDIPVITMNVDGLHQRAGSKPLPRVPALLYRIPFVLPVTQFSAP